MGFFDLGFKGLAVGLHLLQDPPEDRRVVQAFDVAKFVEEDVADQRRREEQQAAVQTDVGLFGAATPTGGLAPDADLLEWDPGFDADLPKPRDQVSVGFPLEPAVQITGYSLNLAGDPGNL